MSDITVFEFKGAKVRTAGSFESPLFCAADVCTVLAYASASQACEKLDEDDMVQIGAEKGSQRSLYSGPNANMYVTEAGLYDLILRSNKPEAKAFKKWVTSEVLPEIRKRGYYNAVEVEARKRTELLLEACFPNAPTKAKPIFSELISALLKMRNEPQVGNPAWAPLLASLVYDWAIPIDGQQEKRRALNAKPSGSRVDHAMFSPEVREQVINVARVGVALAKNSIGWEDWRAKMAVAYRDAPLQFSILTQVRRLPKPEGKVIPIRKRGREEGE